MISKEHNGLRLLAEYDDVIAKHKETNALLYNNEDFYKDCISEVS